MQVPAHDPMFGRWKVKTDNSDDVHWEGLMYSALSIIYLFRLRKHLGCKARKDLPDRGSVNNPYPGIKFVSWEYFPYTEGEKQAYEDKRAVWIADAKKRRM